MTRSRNDIRLALPSKGRLAEGALSLLDAAGIGVHKTSSRHFEAIIPSMPQVKVLFQRASDILFSVNDGVMDFGITGGDIIAENQGEVNNIIPLYQNLGFGHCSLNVIVPDDWKDITTMRDLANESDRFSKPLRIATKYSNLTRSFFRKHNLEDIKIVNAEGTLEVSPTIGYADIIVDLISSGITIRDNHLRALDDGLIMKSQACLIGNKNTIQEKPSILSSARHLLEFLEAHIRATTHVSIFVNIRADSPNEIAFQMEKQTLLMGLQGPTVSPIINNKEGWYAIHIIVSKSSLVEAISQLRAIGGSGVVVTPVTYIFEEEPHSYKQLLEQLRETKSN